MKPILIFIISAILSVELAFAQQNDAVYKIDSLKEILIVSPKPHVTVENNGGFSFNVEELLENTIVDNALDLLQEIPVIVRDGNTFSIPGVGEVNITINGRSRSMSQEQVREILSMTNPNRIKQIVVYFKSPASSGIKGPSINLDILSGRSEELKFSGSLKTTMYQAKKFYPLGYIYGTIESKKWSLDATYALGQGKRRRENNFEITHNFKEGDHNLILHDISSSDNFANRVTATFTYDFANGGQLIAGHYYRFDNNKTNKIFHGTDNEALFAQGSAPINSKKYDHSSYVEYRKGSLNIGANVTIFDNTSSQSNESEFGNNKKSFIDAEAHQTIHSYNAFIDNSKKLGETTIGYGLRLFLNNVSTKQETTRTSGDQEFYRDVNAKHDEQDIRGYIEITRKIGKNIVINGDLYLEYQKASQKAADDKKVLWDRFDIFPNFNINYNYDRNHIVQISYSSDNIYPTYAQSTPRSYYSGYYFTTTGNESLLLGRSNSININYTLYRNVIFGAFANINKNHINQYLLASDRILHGTNTYANFNHVNNYGISASATQKWNDYFNQKISLEIGMNDVSLDKENLYLKKTQNYFIGNLSSNVILNKKKTLLFNFTTLYRTKNINSIYIIKDRFDARASLSYRMPNKGWNFILQGQNIFNTSKIKSRSLLENQKIYFVQDTDSQCLIFTAKYTWNGYREKKEKEIDRSRMGL